MRKLLRLVGAICWAAIVARLAWSWWRPAVTAPPLELNAYGVRWRPLTRGELEAARRLEELIDRDPYALAGAS